MTAPTIGPPVCPTCCEDHHPVTGCPGTIVAPRQFGTSDADQITAARQALGDCWEDGEPIATSIERLRRDVIDLEREMAMVRNRSAALERDLEAAKVEATRAHNGERQARGMLVALWRATDARDRLDALRAVAACLKSEEAPF